MNQSTSTGRLPAPARSTYLDAGTVTINGPAGSSLTNQALTKTNNLYSLRIPKVSAIPGQVNFSLPAAPIR